MLCPADLVDFANQLGDTPEAAVRASISRAYYGVYHAANEFHESLPSGGVVTKPDEGIHGRLYQQLANPTIDKTNPLHTLSRRIGIMGQHIHGMRIKADYKLGESVDATMKAQAIVEAKKVLALIAGT